MKKFYLLLLLICGTAHSQGYYPSLNNLFLNQSGNESLFDGDLDYFKQGFRKATTKLFYKDLQTSNNRNSAFYGLSIIPRFITEADFLETGMFLKYNVTGDAEFPSFPIIFNEYAEVTSESKIGKGDLTIVGGGLSLLFDKSQVKPKNLSGKATTDAKAAFVISRIEYTLENNILEIECTGSFTTDINFKNKDFSKNKITTIKMTAVKGLFTVGIVNANTKKLERIIAKKI